jgi:glycosyltransferase involved in cell wall biosynthesis
VDLVVFNHLSFYDTFPITLAARRLGISTVQCYEDERFEIVSKDSLGLARRIFGINSWLADRWCSRMADGILVISTYLQEKYSRLSRNPERVWLMPTIVDCDQWSCPPEDLTKPPQILYSGGFGEQEELEKVIEALSLVKKKGHGFRLLMLGANPGVARVQKVKELIHLLGLADDIEIRGFVPLDEVREEICRSSILLNIRRDSLWSRSGLSTKLSEFLASGRLVVVSDVGDNARYVKDGESALVVSNPEDVQEIAGALEKAISLGQGRQRVGQARASSRALSF